MNEKENADNYLEDMETGAGVPEGQGVARSAGLPVALAVGVLSALISLVPHLGLSGLDSVVTLLFYPGAIFGIALSLLYRSSKTSAASMLVTILTSAFGYFLAFVLGYFLSIFLTPFGAFAVAGFVGGSMVAVGMRSIVRLKPGAGVKVGLFGGGLGVVAVWPFFKSGFSFLDLSNSWMSFAVLFLVWQVGMMRVVYFYTANKHSSK